MKDTLVQVYADHFDADELELMIEASKHPDQAMKIIMGSKDGMKLAKKTMEVQVDLQRDMAKAFEDRDEDIVDESGRPSERSSRLICHLPSCARTTVIEAAITNSFR